MEALWRSASRRPFVLSWGGVAEGTWFLQFEKINKQIAFCTEKALQTLKFEKSYTWEAET